MHPYVQHQLLYPFENCGFKTIISGVLGAGMGGLFGVLFSSNPGDLSHIPVPDAQGKYPAAPKFNWKQHAQQTWKGAKFYGKSFGMVGAIFAGSECVVEKARGKTDVWNGVLGGCATGAGLAYKGGASAMVLGCAGFSAFSLVIDTIFER